MCGARAVVVKDVESWTIVAGNPSRVVGKVEGRRAGVNESGGQSSTELYSVEGGRNTECNSVLPRKHPVDKVPTAFIHTLEEQVACYS